MGLCLYLALMKRALEDGFTLAVLDDVLMSVDAGHRREVCSLLKTKFPKTQFILTTHDQVWLHERLERNPLRLAILSLIQVATTPRFVMRSPEGLAIARATGSHPPSRSPHLKNAGENRSRSRHHATSVREMDAYQNSLPAPKKSLLSRGNSLLLE